MTNNQTIKAIHHHLEQQYPQHNHFLGGENHTIDHYTACYTKDTTGHPNLLYRLHLTNNTLTLQATHTSTQATREQPKTITTQPLHHPNSLTTILKEIHTLNTTYKKWLKQQNVLKTTQQTIT